MPSTSWTDEPKTSSAEDTLDRRLFAAQAASLIHNGHKSGASVVYGLSGPWGSGKTSMLHMVVESLQAEHKRWRIAKFTPWATSDTNSMLSEFYRSIATSLPPRRGRNAKRALGVIAQIAAPLAEVIPVAGGATSSLLERSGAALTSTPPWDEAFARASDSIKEIGSAVLVVVDDIDRLQADELATLLKVVRLLGRFPGVDYLLAYDNSTVFSALAAGQLSGHADDSPQRFMEKIVQFPLSVPSLSQSQQLRLLNGGLAKAYAVSSRTDTADSRLSNRLTAILGLLTTPRAIERFAAQVGHQFAMLPEGEVDDGDLLLLTLLRVAAPRVFEKLPTHRSELLSGHTEDFAPAPKRSAEKMYADFDPSAILQQAPVEVRRHVSEILHDLFPKLPTPENHFRMNHSRSTRAVSIDAYFDRYFTMTISSDDVADAEVSDAVRAARDGTTALLTDLLSESDSAKQLLILGKIRSELSQRPIANSDEIENVAVVVAKAIDRLADPAGMMFSPQDLAIYILTDILGSGAAHLSEEQVWRVLHELDHAAHRLRAFGLAASSLEKEQPAGSPSWVEPVRARLKAEAFEQFLAHLQEGDNASVDAGVGTQLHFVVESGGAPELRDRIERLVSDGEATIPSLAARMVHLRRIAAANSQWELSDDVDQETFNRVAPPGDDPFYHLDRTTFDDHDLTWANRARAAQGRIKRPSE